MIYYSPSIHTLLSIRDPLKEKCIPLFSLFLVIFFRDSKLTGVTFFDASGTSIKILNPVYRPVDLTYFTFFLSALFKHLYYRAPTKLLTL